MPKEGYEHTLWSKDIKIECHGNIVCWWQFWFSVLCYSHNWRGYDAYCCNTRHALGCCVKRRYTGFRLKIYKKFVEWDIYEQEKEG